MGSAIQFGGSTPFVDEFVLYPASTQCAFACATFDFGCRAQEACCQCAPFTWHFDINFVVAHDSANTSTSLANDHPVDSRIDTDFILDETFKIIDNLHNSIFSLISILFITSYNNCAFIIVVSLPM